MIKNGVIDDIILTIRTFTSSIVCIFLSIFLLIFSFLKSLIQYAEFLFNFSLLLFAFSRTNMIVTETHQVRKGAVLMATIFLFVIFYCFIHLCKDDTAELLENIAEKLSNTISSLTTQMADDLSGKKRYFQIINFSFYISRLFFHVLSFLCCITCILLPGTCLLLSFIVIKHYNNILNFTNTTVSIISILNIIAVIALCITLTFVGIDIKNSFILDTNLTLDVLNTPKVEVLQSQIKLLEKEKSLLFSYLVQLKEENSLLSSYLEIDTSYKTPSKHTEFEKGQFNIPKDFFDSPPERILESYLDKICQKYELGKKYGIRLLAHQPLGNYAKHAYDEDTEDKETQEKIKNTTNKLARMHFDFLFELRKDKSDNYSESRKGHFPLLMVELDGKSHDTPEQQKRDEYKNGVCNKLEVPIIRIRYDKEHFEYQDIASQYETAIIQGIKNVAKKKYHITIDT